jgi:hypothetical protein
MLAHALGNPFRADELRALADRHKLWLVEDCCDAFGSTLRWPQRRQLRPPRHALLLPGAPHHHR